VAAHRAGAVGAAHRAGTFEGCFLRRTSYTGDEERRPVRTGIPRWEVALLCGGGGVLRRMPVDGGEETDYVRDLGIPSLALDVSPFYVTAKGVYYLSTGPDQRGALIRFIGHEGRESKTLGNIPRTPSAGLSVSPDGRFLLYSQYDQSAAEILLVENFH